MSALGHTDQGKEIPIIQEPLGDQRQRRTFAWIGPLEALALLLGLVMLAATLEIVIDGANGHSQLIPHSPQIAGWLSSIGERLGYRVFLVAVLTFSAAYGLMLALLSRLSTRLVIALLAALHLVVFAGPILLSTDVFSYIAYGRMGAIHAINPYTHGPLAIQSDAIYKYVGVDWKHTATAYGPIYTLFSYPIALLGLTGAIWGMKLVALIASLGTLLLTWRCAAIRKVDPKLAVFIVGANPLYVIYGLGGAHNDMLMILLMMAAVSFTLKGRDASAGASVVIGTLVKATVGALLPFMILARRNLSTIAGALAALAGGMLCAFLAFGMHGVDIVSALNRDAALVSTDSFATEIAHLVGKPGVFPIDHDLLKGALVVSVIYLLWRTWRGYDWIAASGWTLLAISVTSTWLLAWYTLWPLPLAVLTRDRRLLYATFAVQALFIIHQISPLIVPVS